MEVGRGCESYGGGMGRRERVAQAQWRLRWLRVAAWAQSAGELGLKSPPWAAEFNRRS